LTLVVVVIACWQAAILARYSLHFPSAIYTGDHVTLNTSCADLFWVTRVSLVLSIILIGIDCAVALASMTIRLERNCQGCISVGTMAEGFGGLVKIYITVSGILAILGSNDRDVEQCSDLYNCAWWCFVGLYVVSAAVGCCICVFFFGLTAGAMAREAPNSNPRREQLPPSVPQYGTLGAIGRAEVQPFSGQGHKLGS